MDTQTPDHAPTPSATDPDGPLSRIFTKRLLQSLAATMPATTGDTAAWGENWEATRELFDSLNPRDPADAQLAAIAVAAAQSAMDNFARAAAPGTSDEQAVRLRGSALAAGRTYAVVQRYLRKRQPEAAQTRPAATTAPDAPEAVAPQPRAEPIPCVDLPRPSDRFGPPTPSARLDPTLRAQWRAGLSHPRDPALAAEAEAMLAGQAALGAHGTVDAAVRGGSG